MKAAPSRPDLGGAPGDSPERRNLSPAALYEHAIRRDEAVIVSTGALTAETGKHTGRSPKDKFFVKEPTSRDAIWWHPGNQPISTSSFDRLLARMQEYSQANPVYTKDVFACADPRHRLRGETLRLAMTEAVPRWTRDELVDNELVTEWRARLAHRYPPAASVPVVGRLTWK